MPASKAVTTSKKSDVNITLILHNNIATRRKNINIPTSEMTIIKRKTDVNILINKVAMASKKLNINKKLKKIYASKVANDLYQKKQC